MLITKKNNSGSAHEINLNKEELKEFQMKKKYQAVIFLLCQYLLLSVVIMNDLDSTYTNKIQSLKIRN